MAGLPRPVAAMRGLAAAALLALLAIAAHAQADRAPPLVDFKHVGWSIEDGAPSRINAIGQGRNGYLWLGGVDGLFRFDGVTFERIERPQSDGGRMVVAQVMGARSGDVWVGLARTGGVVVFRGGRLVDAGMPNPSREVTDIAEDRDGAIWVARGGRSRDTIARFQNGRWEELGDDWGLPEQQVWQILFARDGTMWVVLDRTILRRPPGSRRFLPTGEAVSRRAGLAEDRNGRIWVSDGSGTRAVQTGAVATTQWLTRAYRNAAEVGGSRMMFDASGALWSTTWTNGVFRIAAPMGGGRPAQVETFTAADGLSSDQSHALFQDREGNIWIGTELGLDMLRPASAVVEPAIPPNSAQGYRIASTVDGSVYISDTDTIYRILPGAGPRPMLKVADTPGSLCEATGGAIWVTLGDRVLRVAPDGRVTRTLRKPLGASAYGCAEDRRGRLWFAGLSRGLFWYERGAWHAWPGLSASAGVPGNTAVGPDGLAAILFRSPLPLLGATPFTPLVREQLGIGGLEGILPGRAALYVSGARGMARIAGGRIQRLDGERYPWLASVNGMVQTPRGESWAIGDAGIVRMASAALDRAFAAPGTALPHRVFDFRDGLNSFAQKAPGAQVALGGDGLLWFLTRRNVVRIDPARLSTNAAPPPVMIRAVVANGLRFRDPGALRLAAGTTEMAIDYTALSLSVPDRVRFRYRLEGVDSAWIDPGTRREAVYGNLHPGTFRFHVIAANNDGVWNRAGASVTITVPPTFLQTWPFRIACVIALGLLVWFAYTLRLRQLAERIRARLEERTSERERIARELHDTLLQSVQGLMLRFQSVADHIAEDHPAKPVINKALDRADQMLVEGRDRVRDLRSADRRNLEVILDEIAHEQPFEVHTSVEIAAEGTPRPLQPVILDEIVRISGEALFNAALHAHANKVVVRVGYGRKRLKVSFHDDGVGIDAERLVRAGREGHFGLIGMHERARKVGATLTLDSAPGSGTTVTFSLPAGVAYQPVSGAADRFAAWRRPMSGLWPRPRREGSSDGT
ncbi:two-component regulator propeller domain-containing protein [Sphingomonas sp. CJ20]